MKKYEIDKFSSKDVVQLSAVLPEQDNLDITETAGFIPLSVKFKKFQEQGILLQFQQSEFTSSDIRELYNTPDFEIYPDDDFEDIQEKLFNRQQYINEVIKKNKAPVVNDNNIINEQPKPILSKETNNDTVDK